jgi:hypothetical protein
MTPSSLRIKNEKVKLFVCLIKHRAMHTCWGDTSFMQLHGPATSPPGTGPTASTELEIGWAAEPVSTWWRRKGSLLAGNRCPVVQKVAQLRCRLVYPDFSLRLGLPNALSRWRRRSSMLHRFLVAPLNATCLTNLPRFKNMPQTIKGSQCPYSRCLPWPAVILQQGTLLCTRAHTGNWSGVDLNGAVCTGWLTEGYHCHTGGWSSGGRMSVGSYCCLGWEVAWPLVTYADRERQIYGWVSRLHR